MTYDNAAPDEVLRAVEIQLETRARWADQAAVEEMDRLNRAFVPRAAATVVLVVPLMFFGWPLAVFLGWTARTRLRKVHSWVLDAGSPPHLTYRLESLRMRYRSLWLGTVYVGGAWALLTLVVVLLPA